MLNLININLKKIFNTLEEINVSVLQNNRRIETINKRSYQFFRLSKKLTGKFVKIPFEIENKLKSIFIDEKEYETIKSELLKSPLSFSSEFFTLYNDLMDETIRFSEKKIRYLIDDID